MSPNDIVLIEWRGVFIAQQVRMPMFYRVVSIVAEPEVTFPVIMDLVAADLFQTIWDGTSLLTTLNNNFGLETVRSYNLFDVLDNYEGNADGNLPAIGGSVGNAMPPFSSFAWYQGTTRRDIRSGSRRWPGMGEVHQQNGLVEAGPFEVMEDVAAAFSQTRTVVLPSDGSITITPVIVGREKEVDEEGRVTYRLPTTQEEARYYPATTWIARPNVTTQNTRKTGRGI